MFWRSLVQISVRIPIILTGVLIRFKTMPAGYLETGHELFLPDPFYSFIILLLDAIGLQPELASLKS
jgi:hypothetical protein